MTASSAALTSDDFSSFFSEIFGYEPFPWQAELARRACRGDWPKYLSVPTGSGKTAALDAAVFALASQASRSPSERTAGRRIFYVVNRRVIVDEAYDRARRIASALRLPQSHQPTVVRVANALRALNPGATSPLDCVQLRGGIYRDQRWARSITQPLIVASTVDQVGSRLLFRGYGVSASMRPIHAALVAHDSLLLLDEAHISRPFAQTIASIDAYRALGSGRPRKNGIAVAAVKTPFAFLQMTATPPAETMEADILRLSKKDHVKPTLSARLEAPKRATLVVAKASGAKANENLAHVLAAEAIKLNDEHHPHSIAVLVNRVATARVVAQVLTKRFSEEQVTLLIGRMRPLDRDDVTRHLREELKTLQPGETRPDAPRNGPLIVVATQCLEVGADFDFDALVTECASLDALRQRFGRLNRGGRPIQAHAVIAIRSDQVFPESNDLEINAKALDPIYGTALIRTWNWLHTVAMKKTVDFGLNAMDAHVAAFRSADSTEKKFSRLLSPTKDAPVLLPAYLDAWSQTNPEPGVQPEPALFLHGPGRNDGDVQICWRSDLPDPTTGATLADWPDTISLCPPSSVECLTVPLHEFGQWFLGGNAPDTGDVLDATLPESADLTSHVRRDALIWRGLHDSYALESAADLRPGDTIVLRAQDGGWDTDNGGKNLGHLPGATPFNVDQAERAFRQTKQREILRLRRVYFPTVAPDSAFAELLAWAENPDRDWSTKEIREALARASAEFPENDLVGGALKALATEKYGLDWSPYADERGIVLKTRHIVPRLRSTESSDEQDDDGNDSPSKSTGNNLVTLASHVADVIAATAQSLSQVPLASWSEAFTAAATLHDCGKADERFQALLLNGTPALAWAQSELFAKSAKMPETAAAYELARRRAELPKGFRHEMLSTQLAETETAVSLLPSDALLRTLALHLIASHHGYARPFAPIISDDTPPHVEIQQKSVAIRLATDLRSARPAHRIDSGVAERFWQLNRHFGWWGLAYLEAVLRLADQQASAKANHAGVPS